MSPPNVTMQMPAGSVVPSIIYLNDGSTVTPNANGQITVATKFIGILLAAGWQIVTSASLTVSGGTASGSIHIP